MRAGRMSAALAGGFLLAGLLACEKRADRDQSTGMARSEVEDTATTTGGTATATAYSDANIVALLDHANEADSSAGALAAKKATNPKVKSFAKLMMSEHHALRQQGQQLAQKLNVTPQPPADDPVTALASKETSALESAPKGAEFDRTYITQEIAAHEAVLDLAGRAHDSAQNPELKKLIEQAKPVIEKHLDQAKEIQKELGSS